MYTCGWVPLLFTWNCHDIVNWLCCCCSVTQSCPTLCEPWTAAFQAFFVPHHLPEFAQVHVHCIGDAIQPYHSLMPSSPSALSLSQHQELFQWVIWSHQMTEILELQHPSFKWIFRVDLPGIIGCTPYKLKVKKFENISEDHKRHYSE